MWQWIWAFIPNQVPEHAPPRPMGPPHHNIPILAADAILPSPTITDAPVPSPSFIGHPPPLLPRPPTYPPPPSAHLKKQEQKERKASKEARKERRASKEARTDAMNAASGEDRKERKASKEARADDTRMNEASGEGRKERKTSKEALADPRNEASGIAGEDSEKEALDEEQSTCKLPKAFRMEPKPKSSNARNLATSFESSCNESGNDTEEVAEEIPIASRTTTSFKRPRLVPPPKRPPMESEEEAPQWDWESRGWWRRGQNHGYWEDWRSYDDNW